MLMPLTLPHATQRFANASAALPSKSIRHRGTRRARLERFHYKVAALNLERVVTLGENWSK